VKSRKPTRAPTLDDVARSAGLSSMTVSRALNTPQLVRPKTVEKVMQAVQATGYIPNALAGGLASGAASWWPSWYRKSITICLSIPSRR
jgi:LacI family gluconate utilization system Gnt-I transcriptional repressor